MKQVLLDTNFILTCIKQKIDFFEELKLIGLQILIPKQVINEIKRLSNSKKINLKNTNEIALKILENNKFKEIDLKEKFADKGIINYAEKNTDIYIATLDKEIKEKTLNSKIVIREKSRLENI